MTNFTKEPTSTNLWSIHLPLNTADFLTPHKLSIVFLIQEYLQDKTASNEIHVPYPPKYRRQFCMLLLKLIQYPDMSYKDLHNLLTSPLYGIKKSHLEGFEYLMMLLHKLGIEILFDLQNLMDKLMSESASTNGGVSQYGIVGLYLRRVHVTLDKMTFPELMMLYKNIKTYYEKGVRALAISPDSTIGLNDSHESRLFSKEKGLGKWSNKQAELFVAQQSAFIQNNETMALNPIDMHSRLQEITTDNPLYTQAHFLSYMNSVRTRDFLNSLDSLHRAFDRSTTKINSSETRGFQYSSLNLAIMHTQFGHTNEALSSLRECIMLGQESGDRVCLQLAQSWLWLLDKNQIRVNEQSMPTKGEVILAHSISLGVQFIVKMAAITGFNPSKLFELMMKSDVLNCQHSMMDLISNCVAQRAAIWTLYGKSELASLNSQLLLNSNLKFLGKSYNGEGICHSLCCVALWMGLNGDYVDSSVVLQHAKERFPRDPLSRFWMICDCYISTIQAIHKQQWQEAIDACTKLFTLDKTLSLLQHATLNVARGNLKVAQNQLNSLLNQSSIDPLIRVRSMILLSHTMVSSDSFAADVINLLNSALIFAQKKYLDYEVSLIEMNIANVLLKMGMPHQALKSVKSGLENVLSNGGIYDKAKIYFLYVRCLIAGTKTKKDKINKMTESMDILCETIEYFMKLEAYSKVKDVYCFIANFYNDVELNNERNKFAFKFRQIEEQFPTSSEYLNIFF